MEFNAAMRVLCTLRPLLLTCLLAGSSVLWGQHGRVFHYQCGAPISSEQKSFLTGLAELDAKAVATFNEDLMKVRLALATDPARLNLVLERSGLGGCALVQRKAEATEEFVGGTQQGTIATGSGQRQVVITQR